MRKEIQQSRRKEEPGPSPVMGIIPSPQTGDKSNTLYNDPPPPDHGKKANGNPERNEETAEPCRTPETIRFYTPSGFLLLLIKFYQKAISPWMLPCCRFQPTCSHYATEAIIKHGVIKGVILAVWRIMRCNPFCRGGYDPVPELRQIKKNDIYSEKITIFTQNYI